MGKTICGLDLSLILNLILKMRVARAAILRLGCAFRGQRRHLRPHFLEDVQVDLASWQLAGQALVAEGVDVRHDPVNQSGDLVDLGGAEAALREPRRAEPDAHRQAGLRVAGDGVLVGDDARHVEDAHGRLAA